MPRVHWAGILGTDETATLKLFLFCKKSNLVKIVLGLTGMEKWNLIFNGLTKMHCSKKFLRSLFRGEFADKDSLIR